MREWKGGRGGEGAAIIAKEAGEIERRSIVRRSVVAQGLYLLYV